MQLIKSVFGLIILAAIAALVYVGLNNSRMMPQASDVLSEWKKPFEAETPRETASAKDGEISGVDPAELSPPVVELGSPPPAEPSSEAPAPNDFSDASARALVPVTRPESPPAPPAALMEAAPEEETPGKSLLQPPGNARPGVRGSSGGEVVQTSAISPAPEDAIPEQVRRLLNDGKLSEALLELTRARYGPGKETAAAERIDGLLGQLAGTVIYSDRCFSDPPYQVQSSDTWENLAGRFGTTPTFLARINRLNPNEPLPVGRSIKVVRGPFDATVSLGRRELVLTVNGRYAGRFLIGVGDAVRSLSGSFIVQSKTRGPTYQDGNRSFGPGDPGNPLGDCLINLDRGVGLHGTSSPESLSRDGGPGWIRLSNHDINDLDAILTVGSRIVIQP